MRTASCPVVEYITEEVHRQGHDMLALDGVERVEWMLSAWTYALNVIRLRSPDTSPTIMDAVALGQLIERQKNNDGIRKVGVMVGSHVCPHPQEVPRRLERLFGNMPDDPFAFYREFELIHPFVDGNGRTGKVLLNWLNGSLLNPVFPPDDFWGREILNP